MYVYFSLLYIYFFFFFKQRTAYELRISDWSSDVCSSDLPQGLLLVPDLDKLAPPGPHGFHVHAKGSCGPGPGDDGKPAAGIAAGGHYDPRHTGKHLGQIGRAHV